MEIYTLAGVSVAMVFFGVIFLGVSRKWNKAFELAKRDRLQRLSNWEQGQEIYKALKSSRDIAKLNSGDLDEIVALRGERDAWNDCENFTQDQKLILIFAGFNLETATEAVRVLGWDALKIQSKLAN